MCIKRTCVECGTEFRAVKMRSAIYCSQACRLKANNRRRERGALIYDLLCHHRFNRAEAQKQKVRSKVDRMISTWMREDIAAGRRPMRPLRECLEAVVEHSSVRLR